MQKMHGNLTDAKETNMTRLMTSEQVAAKSAKARAAWSGNTHAQPSPKARGGAGIASGGPSGTSLTLNLPYPPSKNALDVRRVAISKAGKQYSARSDSPAYRSYKAAVKAEVYRQRGPRGGCDLDLAIDVTLYPPDRRRRDLLNTLEALCDALTHAGVWLDDSQIVLATVRRGMVCEGGKCVIRIDAI